MTAPRRILPGVTVMITRRSLGRMFLLRPSKTANALLSYILAVVSKRYRVQLHALCVLSNHLHCVLSDPEGKLPEFVRDLDALVARSFNALHGRWESFWAPGSYSVVTLETAADILEKRAYVLANPVAAGLVRTGTEWPGVRTQPEQIGAGQVEVRRPQHFFRENGPLPESEVLEFSCPPGFESVEEFREQLAKAVRRKEDEAVRDLAAERRAFLGVAKVLAQKPHARPSSGEHRWGLNPRIACRDKWKRIEAIQRLKSFRVAYREAWEEFTLGLRDTVFPGGTYWMRVAYGVPCAPAG